MKQIRLYAAWDKLQNILIPEEKKKAPKHGCHVRHREGNKIPQKDRDYIRAKFEHNRLHARYKYPDIIIAGELAIEYGVTVPTIFKIRDYLIGRDDDVR